MDKVKVLSHLGWPASKMEQDGLLRWNVEGGGELDVLGSAMVSARGESIKAFAKATTGMGAPWLDVELLWEVTEGTAREVASKKDGHPCDFGLAFLVFLDALALAEPPVFKSSAPGPSSVGMSSSGIQAGEKD